MFAAVVVPLVVSGATLRVAEPTEWSLVVAIVVDCPESGRPALGVGTIAVDESVARVVESKTVPDERVP